MPLALQNAGGFMVEELAEQRSQFEKSFANSLVGQLEAGYLQKSPWFAAFERGVNDFEWQEGKPVGRRNFVDKLFAMWPETVIWRKQTTSGQRIPSTSRA